MSNDSKNFTPEEKKKIALEAASGDQGTLANLAEKHEVSVEEIKRWMRETGVDDVNNKNIDDRESVSVSATEEFAHDYEFGATPDHLNYRRLFFWSIFGTAVVLIFIIAVFNVYEYTFQGIGQQSSESSQYYEVNELRENDQEQLNSFGVVDLEEGVYHIPIDSAIAKMAEESQ